MKPQPNWVGLIQTASSDIRRLGAVQRYSSIPIVATETTDQHSYYVALYALMIHAQVYPGSGYDYLAAALAVKALLHDMSDSIAGDVVRVFKYSSVKFRKAVHEAEDMMLQRLPKEVLSLLTRANLTKKDQAYVDAVVKASDFLSLYQYMRREVMRQNFEIIPFYGRMTSDIASMIQTSKRVGNFDAPDFYRALHETSILLYDEAFADRANKSTLCGDTRDFTNLGWCKVI